MLLLVSCTPKGPLDKTLSSAKENRSELQKVLKHYANDSLKLEATKFLIYFIIVLLSDIVVYLVKRGIYSLQAGVIGV